MLPPDPAGPLLYPPSLPTPLPLPSLPHMHLYGLTFGILLPALALYRADYAVAVPSLIASPADLAARNPSFGSSFGLSKREDVALFSPRDGHEHGHGHGTGAPIVELNETDVLLGHALTPLSYWSIDIDGYRPGETRHPGLMALHAIMMTLAFFGALPAGQRWSLLHRICSDSLRQELLFVP